MRFAAVMWTALIIVAGVAIFMVSYRVQALENELQAKRQQIEHDRSTIRVLEAEWAYLNDPDRLRRLSEQHFGFVAPSATTITSFDRLPLRDDVTAVAGQTAMVDVTPDAAVRGVAAIESSAIESAGATPTRFSLDRVRQFLEPMWQGPEFLRASWRTREATP